MKKYVVVLAPFVVEADNEHLVKEYLRQCEFTAKSPVKWDILKIYTLRELSDTMDSGKSLYADKDECYLGDK